METNTSIDLQSIPKVTALDKTVNAFAILSCVLSVWLNFVILFVYMKNRSLRTPFNAYIANISFAEILCGILATPGNIIRSFYGYWPFNDSYCSFTLYWIYITSPEVRWAHALIAINRVWAVTFPLHYRQKHTTGVAKVLILLSWVFQHVVHLPVFIRGRMQLDPNDKVCLLNIAFQYELGLTAEIVGFLGSEVVMLLATLFMIFKLKKVKAQKLKISAQQQHLPDSHLPNVLLNNPALIVAMHHNSHETTTRVHSHTVEDRILIYLIVVTLFCWTPSNVYWILVQGAGYCNNIFMSMQLAALYAASWLHPILFYVTLPSFRRAIYNIFHSS